MGDRFTENTRSRGEIGGNSKLVNFVEWSLNLAWNENKDDQSIDWSVGQSVSQSVMLVVAQSVTSRHVMSCHLSCHDSKSFK